MSTSNVDALNQRLRQKPLLFKRFMARTQVNQDIDITSVRGLIDEIYVDPKLEQYILNLVTATKEPAGAAMSSPKISNLF